uniref:Uncharacterized protein n=1 Tax=Timema cristinae TaxID=61476 RepID=A0A7R9GNZ9_TIMCR|nr:unnamed protein product [Timema cristinae]
MSSIVLFKYKGTLFDSYKTIEGCGGVPPIRPLETLHNALSLRQLDAFLDIMTSAPLFRTPASSPPKYPSTPLSSSIPPILNSFTHHPPLRLQSPSNSEYYCSCGRGGKEALLINCCHHITQKTMHNFFFSLKSPTDASLNMCFKTIWKLLPITYNIVPFNIHRCVPLLECLQA